MSRRSDKRERLVNAAKQLIHQQGYNETTLADIAQAADVPLGNVYYYFKTKDAIGEAVLAERAKELQLQFAVLDQIPSIKERLQVLVKDGFQALSETLNYGCAVGSLCQELSKQGGELAERSANIMKDILRWTETQFTALGKTEKASQLATYLVASLQGSSLLASTFKNEEVNSQQQSMLCKWIEEL